MNEVVEEEENRTEMGAVNIMEMETMKKLLTTKEKVVESMRIVFHAVKESGWKNERAKNNNAYVPTMKEHIANILTHGVIVIPTIYLSYLMISSATGTAQLYCSLVYGAVLTGLFLVSTVFHTVAAVSSGGIWRDLLHRSDRAMIYLFIAGSYTPWLQLRHLDGMSVELRWAVWLLALLGITYQQLFHERYKALETIFYVIIATLPSVAVLEMHDKSGLSELQAGGAVYLAGVVFFKSDGIIPLAHAIWHLHVVVGAVIHYQAVNTYLITPTNYSQ